MSDTRSSFRHGLPIPFWEFVVLCAMMVAIGALSIDIMLPGLPDIGDHFGLTDPNARQTVVTSYMLGFASGQLIAGPLSDRFGRKPVLVAGFAVFLLATAGAIVSGSFEVLLVMRLIQGFGGAAPRTVAVAIVRDLFAGREMARVMSFIMMVFIMVPVFAPAVGSVMLAYGGWTWMFVILLVFGILATTWSQLRMPETRPAHDRVDLMAGPLFAACRQVVTSPATMIYIVALGLMFGCLLGYISSAQQVFVDTYRLGDLFPLAFGSVALSMAVASLINARFVGRLGMRRLSHLAVGGFAAVSCALLVAELFGSVPVLVFIAALGACFFLLGLIIPNLNSLAMEPHGHIAGMASSVVGFLSTTIGAVLGWAVGQVYDGSGLPLAAGFAALSLSALALISYADRA